MCTAPSAIGKEMVCHNTSEGVEKFEPKLQVKAMYRSCYEYTSTLEQLIEKVRLS